MNFFESPRSTSLLKSKIVSDYFKAWSQIMLRQREGKADDRIAYVDLFCGPGKYETGEESTPPMILNAAIASPALRSRLVTIFNDANAQSVDQLRGYVASLAGVDEMRHRPEFTTREIGPAFAAWIGAMRLVPTLFFADPWGYKGLSLELIGDSIRDWGCECIFFFAYNSINRSVTIESVSSHIDDLFGANRAATLRDELAGLPPEMRKATILQSLTSALKSVGGQYVLPFEFVSYQADRPSHYVIHVSKHFRGFSIMRDIMYSISSDEAEVRSLFYNPNRSPQLQLLADFGAPNSTQQLMNIVTARLSGQTLSVQRAYELCTGDNVYRMSDLKRALERLEGEGRLTLSVPASERRVIRGKRTLPEHLLITVPVQ